MEELDYAPHSTEAEASVIGAAWMTPSVIDDVRGLLSERDFYDDRNRLLWRYTCQLRDQEGSLDAISVKQALRADGKLGDVGGEEYMVGIVDAIPTASNVRFHARHVKDNALRRRLIQVTGELRDSAAQPGARAKEVLEKAEDTIFRLTQSEVDPGAGLLEARVMMHDVVRQIMEGPKRAFKTGFHDLDLYTNGFRPKELVVLAARPSMGKTGLAFQIAAQVAIDKRKSVGVFSLEMGAEDAIKRMVAIRSSVSVNRIIQGPPDFNEQEMERIDQAVHSLDKSDMYVDGQARLTASDIRTRARRMKQKAGLDLLVVDYLQRMAGQRHRNSNRNDEIGEIIQDLKSVSKDLDCTVLVLSQLSRKVESRSDKMPMMSDLRESGDIEQEADCIIMMYRPAYYLTPSEATHSEVGNVTRLSVAKNRNGPTGNLQLTFLPETASFRSYGGSL